MKTRSPLLFFLLPYAGALAVFAVLAAFNRSFIRDRTERLVREQLLATSEILKAGVRDLLGRNVPPERLLERYGGADDIYFMAVLDERFEILDWSSQFEGYLPFSRKDPPREEAWITETPAGRVFNVFKQFRSEGGASFYLYLGISLRGLEDMLARSRGNLRHLFGILAAAGLVLFGEVFRLHRLSLSRAEEAVAERQEKERLREISGFTAGIAHEIKNPLNSLALLAELMAKKAPPDLAADIALGRAEIRRIAGIVDAFSDAAKPLVLRREDVKLAEVADGVRLSLLPEAEPAGVEIAVRDPDRVRVSADRGLIAQALLNLLRNAVEAAPGGRVEVGLSRRKRKAVIRVEDTGRGIPAEIAGRLFEPFVSSKPDGLGVGLFLVRKIVVAHGGAVEAAARPGGGTVFTLELPRGSP
ncbi:MAG: HAMP domain-containing histidine kinase [Candidatus Aminicenantes bacterium]|nr:HAMP domain-containing histidine kinase [Candidatus Aminicenantes bacterium]